MKTCATCKVEKSLDEFQKRASNKDGHTGICKVCKRDYDNAYYKANPDRKAYIRTNSKNRELENKKYILDYLNSHPCVDCAESDVVVLEFDHRGDKNGNIAIMMTRNSLTTLKQEIDKCDVRCANCHRRKTAKDFGYWRLIDTMPL
jgi:hypothetical protein